MVTEQTSSEQVLVSQVVSMIFHGRQSLKPLQTTMNNTKFLSTDDIKCDIPMSKGKNMLSFDLYLWSFQVI